jgi:molybdopterin-guanine dinucleotide biosynthesis protein A
VIASKIGAPLVGILVGGASRRMGGAPKGLLVIDGETIVARLVRVVRSLSLDVVLVGDLSAYDDTRVPRIADAAPDSGPLAGLVALLRHAAGRDAITLACDLPRVLPSTIDRLARSPHATCAPKIDGRWQPLAARWSASLLPMAERRLAERMLALHALLDEACAAELELDAAERDALVDWDSPADVDRS